MDSYPLNLILAVATATASIFIGFLPTKTISYTFFARESAKFIFAWGLIALTSPHAIFQYPLLYAFLCFASWWNFRRDKALTGKMWLSVASGLSVSVGVMFILAVTPRAYPPGLSPLSNGLLLASIYLGGAVIGLAYVCFTFIQSTRSNFGVTQGVIQRYVGLLPYLTIVRAAAILATFFTSPARNAPNAILITLVLAVLVLPALALVAQKQASLSSRIQPTRILIAMVLVGFLTEILARLLVL